MFYMIVLVRLASSLLRDAISKQRKASTAPTVVVWACAPSSAGPPGSGLSAATAAAGWPHHVV
jgi:hypothetical protein